MRVLLAIVFLVISQTPSQAQKPDSVRLQLLLRQSRSDSIHHNYLSAIQHLNQYLALKNVQLEDIKKQQIGRLQAQYQTVKKDLEIRSREKNIRLLSKQNNLMDRNLKQTRLIRTVTITVMIAAGLLLAASFVQYRLKRQANMRLQKQQVTIDQKNHTLENLVLQKDDLLEEKELLIKEIHHRVKNNLQVVISLLNTQSAYLNDPRTAAAIRQSQYRMQSISLIHQKLYQSESRALINIKEYTHELIQYLRQSFDTGSRIAFKLDITEINLDVLRAVPLGLILNEAITNGLQHAFPDSKPGDINVALGCTDDDHFRLLINDNGRGLPTGFDMDACQSLGMNLIKSMCREIGGQLLVRQTEGLGILIKFPVSNYDISPFDERFKVIRESAKP